MARLTQRYCRTDPYPVVPGVHKAGDKRQVSSRVTVQQSGKTFIHDRGIFIPQQYLQAKNHRSGWASQGYEAPDGNLPDIRNRIHKAIDQEIEFASTGQLGVGDGGGDSQWSSFVPL